MVQTRSCTLLQVRALFDILEDYCQAGQQEQLTHLSTPEDNNETHNESKYLVGIRVAPRSPKLLMSDAVQDGCEAGAECSKGRSSRDG